MQEETIDSDLYSYDPVDSLSALASTWTRMGTAKTSPQQTLTVGNGFIEAADPQSSQLYSFSSALVTQHSWTGDSPYLNGDSEDYPQSIIHDEARVCNWDNVLKLCETHPHLAAFTSPRESQTALHHACDRRCPLPEVLDSLIRAFPQALTLTDQKGWTPLHCACRFKAPLEAVQILLHSYPELGRIAAQEKCKVMHRIPLFYAIRYEAPVGVVELLLEYLQGVEDILEKDKVGISILSLVWDSWAMREGKNILAPIGQYFDKILHRHAYFDAVSRNASTTNVSTQISIPHALQLQLEKVQLILQGAYHHRPGRGKWRLLHACAAMNCHLSLFMVACVLYPEQAREVDEDDLYHKSVTGHQMQPPNKQTALHLAAKVQSQGLDARKVLIALLTLYPEAAAFPNPRDNCYPLHYLCNNESKVHWVQDGFRDLYEANPNVIYQGNHLNQLPLHLAASIARYRPSPVISPMVSHMVGHTQDVPEPLQHPNIDAVGSIIQNLIENFPESPRKTDHHGMLPFHYTAKTSEMWTLDVEVLYMSYPEVIHTSAGFQCSLPLHLAVGNEDAKGDFINALVKLYPQGCATTNHEGKLPLHLACESGKRWDEGIECIYDAHKAALMVTAGNTGKLPIHFAAAAKACSKELLVELVQRNMKSTMEKDSQGQTPLHLVIQSGKLWDDGIDVLVHVAPDSMDMVDDKGMIPFVLAALNHCNTSTGDSIRSLETLFQLLQRVPYILNHYCNA